MRELVSGLLQRLRLESLLSRHKTRHVLALFNLVNGGVSIGLLAGVAYVTRSPFLFPSLGPTALLLFYKPRDQVSAPQNVLIGHSIGAVVGWLCLAVFGLLDVPPALMAESWARAGAAALSLGGTSALMVLLRAVHPPATATTLIVSLGLMPHLWQIPVLVGAVALLLAQAFVINRLAGIEYPFWGPAEGAAEADEEGGVGRERPGRGERPDAM